MRGESTTIDDARRSGVLASYHRAGCCRDSREDLDRVFELFPHLHERIKQEAGTMPGGEQQMLAIGRALMSQPKLLLLDEPSMGLAPVLVERIFQTIQEINQQGTTVLLAEQNANGALEIATRGYVLESGSIVESASAEKTPRSARLTSASFFIDQLDCTPAKAYIGPMFARLHTHYAPSIRNKRLAWTGYGFGHTVPRHPGDVRGTVIGKKGRFKDLWTKQGGDV